MEVFNLEAKIGLDKSEYEKGIGESKRSFSDLASGIGKGLATVAKIGATAVAAGATGVAALTKMGIEGYAQYEQLAGGAELMWGDAYKFIADKAKNAYATVQMSQNDYLQQVNGFAVGLKVALGGNEAAAADLASRIIEAEADIVAATGNTQENVQNAFNGIMKNNFSMVDNLGLGITATKEGFQTMIDSVNEYNAAHGKSTQYQIDNVADCQAALLDYIDMQGMSGYAAAEAAGTIEGSVSMMKAAWSNLVVGMADENADLETLIGNFVGSVVTVKDNIKPIALQALEGIGTLITELAPVISELIPTLIEEVLPPMIAAGASLVSALASGIIESAPAILQAAIDAVVTVLEALGVPSETTEAAISAIGTAFTTVKDAIQPLIDKIAEYVTSGEAAEDISTAINTALDFLQTAYTTVCDVVNTLVTGFQDAVTWGKEHETTLALIATAVGTLTAAIVAYNIAQAIKNAGGIVELAQLASIAVGVGALTVAETAHTVATTVATAAMSAWGAVLAFVTSPITLVIVAIGALIAIGVALYKNWDDVTKFCRETWTKVTEIWGNIKSAVSDAISAVKSAIASGLSAAASAVSEKLSSIKEKFSSIFSSCKTAVSDAIEKVKTKISGGLATAYETVTGKLGDIKQKFSDIFEGAKTIVSDAIEAIKGFFNFSWSLPDLKLPHISVTGGKAPYGIGGKGSLPKFSIEWYRKAYDNAMVLSSPTIFGYSAASGKFLGGGDGNGNEIVAGESHLMNLIGGVVEAKTAEQNARIVGLLSAMLEEMSGGNKELVRAIMADRTFAVGEREFGRLVRQYA